VTGGAGPGRPRAGVAVAALYLLVIVLGPRDPGLLLYDGPVPLPPYRWVSPPRELAAAVQRPASGGGAVTIGALESMPGDASTGDEQAVISFAEGTFAKASGESAVDVRLTPLAPRTVASAPRGLQFDGNAYRITASYAGSGRRAVLTKPATVVLRFPIHATAVLRAASGGWVRLRTARFAESQQVAANTDQLGVFVAAGPSGVAALWPWARATWILAAGALVLTAAAMWLRRRQASRR
jgi:hypothetical protein